jgi:hypothetical protein
MKYYNILKTALLLFGLVNGIAYSQINNFGFEELNSDGGIRYWGNTVLRTVTIDSNGHSTSDSIQYDKGLWFSTNDAFKGKKALEMRNAFNVTKQQGEPGAVFYSSDTVQSPYSSLVPFSGRPANFSFYYKYFPVKNDTASGSATFYNSNGEIIGLSNITIPFTATSFNLASQAIQYLKNDSVSLVQIHFTASTKGVNASFGTRFIIDEVSFNTLNKIKEPYTSNVIKVSPNPAQSVLNISMTECPESPKYLEIINNLGQIVLAENLETKQTSITVESLNAGVYYLKVMFENGKIGIQKWVKN